MAFAADPLDDVVPAAALLVAADLGHRPVDLVGQRDVAAVRAGVVDAHQVPGDLEVVADDRPVLLPAPGQVVAPVLVEPLLDERAVGVVGEALLDGVGDRRPSMSMYLSSPVASQALIR